mmetsp:Transcript_9730/g.13306  ORF Transcript_9730/g.13306 Transcript_9730/m.13306 type:complete len:334 (+) Transcript_9730:749-1750(+)
MLDHHDAGVSHELLGVVVDKLSVDEHVGSVGKDLVHLRLHLLLLGLLDLGNGGHRVNLDFGAHDLDLVVIHGGVGDEDAGVLDTALAAHGDGLLEDHAVGDERVSEGATGLLDDLDVVEVTAALQSQHGLNGKLSERLAIVEQQLRGEGGHGDVAQVLLEGLGVVRVVHGNLFQNFPRRVASLSPALNDDLGVDFLGNELLGLLEELTGHDGDGGGAITDLLVLSLGDVDEDLGGGVVDVDRFENSGTIVGDSDGFARVLVAHRLQDLVHTLGAQGRLHEVSDCDRANKRLQSGELTLVLRGTLHENLRQHVADHVHLSRNHFTCSVVFLCLV